jgi:uncharacterized membrane protein YphA (DoxX/SURF4 family)
MNLIRRIIQTHAPSANILIRVTVGSVFLSEGIQKFLFPGVLGPGRFEKIGFPDPALLAYFAGSFEISCGALVILGVVTRLAVLPLICVISMAILSTKIPILLGHDLLWFHVGKASDHGFWAMAHEARTDFAMLMGGLYLLLTGGGAWSIDALLSRSHTGTEQKQP